MYIIIIIFIFIIIIMNERATLLVVKITQDGTQPVIVSMATL